MKKPKPPGDAASKEKTENDNCVAQLKEVKKTYSVDSKLDRPFKFEFKEPIYSVLKPSKPKTGIELVKESIRKLPMFENFSD